MNHFHRYDEIIHLPHPVSQTHPRMGRLERAAQFSPFAALTGYDDAVRETARLTDAQRELAEDEQQRCWSGSYCGCRCCWMQGRHPWLPSPGSSPMPKNRAGRM